MSALNRIVQIANRPGFYSVPSSDGQGAYEVHGRTGSCTCKDYLVRRAGTYELCKHGRALKAHLEALAACPQCGGRGFYVTSLRLQSGNEPIPCGTCDGSGRRDQADPRLVALWDRERAEARERDLREMFR